MGPVEEKLENIGPESYRVTKRTAQGELIYDVIYRYRDGRRITPLQPQPTWNLFSVIAMGCSFTLGEGLEEDQTIPAFMQRKFQNAAIHNAAWHGWGPGDILLSLRQEEASQFPSPLKNLPQAPKTIGIFVLVDSHFDRIDCNLNCHRATSEWLRERPDFRLNEKGELAYRGRMQNTREFPRWLEILADSATFTELGLNGIGRFSHRNQEKMAKILISIRDELAKRTKLENFYVLHHPKGENPDLTLLNDTLRANRIKILEPAMELGTLTGGRSSIPLDWHPSPQLNFLLADYLSSTLKTDNPNLR